MLRDFEMVFLKAFQSGPIKAISEESYWEPLWGAIKSLREWYIEPLRVIILRAFERGHTESFWEGHVEGLWEAGLASRILNMKRH